MNLEEIKSTINYLLDNNLNLIEKGQNKIAINIVGEAGCGKTSIIQQIAEERGAGYKRLCISELEEIGDLCGVPVKEYAMHKNGIEKWVTDKVVDRYANMGWELCEECLPRMNYAIPEWVPKDPEQEYILTLDDFTRGSQLFMQAIMSLIQFGEYVSWKLPKKCHLILTSNPDDGAYSVSSLDEAQSTRLITFNVDFDEKIYAKWCDKVGIRSELINFMLLNPEIFKNKGVNARTYTMFANALNGIKDFSTSESLLLTSLIGSGCFGENGELVSNFFVTFVHNHLDRLITAEQLLNGEWKDVQVQLRDNVYQNGDFRSDIASALTLRLSNYIEQYFDDKKNTDKKKTEKVVNRLKDIILSSEHLLTEDLIFKLVKTLNYKYPNRLTNLIAIPEIRKKILA